MEALDLAVKILDEARTQIQANMALHYRTKKGERWVNASGRSSNAFQVVTDENHAQLIYQGDNVAPLETIQGGTDEEPDAADIMRWHSEKFGEEISEESAQRIADKIGREGTERWQENQDWIITPIVETAAQALVDQIGAAYIKDLKTFLV